MEAEILMIMSGDWRVAVVLTVSVRSLSAELAVSTDWPSLLYSEHTERERERGES